MNQICCFAGAAVWSSLPVPREKIYYMKMIVNGRDQCYNFHIADNTGMVRKRRQNNNEYSH